MNHSMGFCSAGSAILVRVAVASSVLALRARSIASVTSAISPVSGVAGSLRGAASFDALTEPAARRGRWQKIENPHLPTLRHQRRDEVR